MQIKTLLNRLHPLKSFVYDKVSFCNQDIIVKVLPRKNSKAIRSTCGRPAPRYDCCSQPRRFKFVPLWGLNVYLSYHMRRVNCRSCGIKVEKVPWACGKSSRCKVFELFLAQWARKLSWQEVAVSFSVHWTTVYASVKSVVEYGLAHRCLEHIRAIGVDEICCAKGRQYLTVVYQLDAGMRRLLYVGADRNVKSLLGFFREVGPRCYQSIEFVCSDMWKPYLKVIAKKIPSALHILDRFHLVANLNKAINEIRATEARKMRQEGYQEVLTHTKYCFLKRQENLTDNQRLKLRDVLQYDLKTVRAYLLKESFQLFWSYSSPYWA